MSGTAARAGWIVGIAAAIAMFGGCYQEPVALTTYPPTEPPGLAEPTVPPGPTDTPTSSVAEPTDAASLTPAASTADCVNGWTALSPGSHQYEVALAVLESQMEVIGPWTVEDVRYFTGPDVAWADPPAEMVVRWYIKAALADDPAFRGRWLIERRSEFDQRVVAVAPYDSGGFQTPDWTGFVGDGQPTSYLDLPGEWVGSPYDFVSGEGFSGQPGLPDEVTGCLSDT